MSPPSSSVDRIEARKRAVTGQLLLRAARLFNNRAITRAQRAMPELRLVHTTIIPHIDFEGTRIVEIARRMDQTKQAVSQLVDELESMGMVAREPDPSDGRAKLVKYTDKGLQQMMVGLEVLADVDAELAAEVGERRMDALRKTLAQMVEILERDSE